MNPANRLLPNLHMKTQLHVLLPSSTRPDCFDVAVRTQLAPHRLHYDAITPSFVRKIMTAAVIAGWVPDCPGPELSFVQQPDVTERLR